ncbi:MAG: class I SAM-dependent methyltransferase [Bdellovibrionaceae bacterium]|nr:class I SAM-dependent methyltransferase [Pseudobdellovibrionaceae bacterium]
MVHIPRGNTQKNVSRDVYETLLPELKNEATKMLVDIPCGDGSFAEFIQNSHPKISVVGADLHQEASGKLKAFYKSDAVHFLKYLCPKKVDIITCISGVMCFDRIEELFQQFSKVLKNNGIVIITNDNVHTIRDRLSFLMFGYFKRFNPFYKKNEGIWKVVLPQEIVMHLEKNGFDDIKIKYTSTYYEDFLFFPLAVILFPVCVIGLLPKAQWNLRQVLKIYSFKMLIGRHYIVSAKKYSLGLLCFLSTEINQLMQWAAQYG